MPTTGGYRTDRVFGFPDYIPTIYDDEFSGASLDPKWGWHLAGAPAVYGVSSSRFWADLPAGAGIGNHVFLGQPLPAQNFEFYTKVTSNRTANFNGIGLSLIDSVAPYVYGVRQIFASAYHNADTGLVNEYYPAVFTDLTWWRLTDAWSMLKMRYNISTKLVECFFSDDGTRWKLVHSKTLAWTPDYLGLYMQADNVTIDTNVAARWFRVELI